MKSVHSDRFTGCVSKEHTSVRPFLKWKTRRRHEKTRHLADEKMPFYRPVISLVAGVAGNGCYGKVARTEQSYCERRA